MGILGLMIISSFVYAYNPSGTGGNPAVMGHSGDELGIQLKCTQAYIRSSNVSAGITAPIILTGGDASAIEFYESGTKGATTYKWGLTCQNNYQKTGCLISTNGYVDETGFVGESSYNPSENRFDADIAVTIPNTCAGDDDEYRINSAISIICCKLG